MHRLLITGALCLALGGCATASPKTLAVCDGRHRRPANPNGSVLVAPAPPQPSPSAAAAPRPAKPAKTAALTASYAPCGDRA